MDETRLKEAFSKIKEEMFYLVEELSNLRKDMQETNQLVKKMDEEIIHLKLDLLLNNSGKPTRNTPKNPLNQQSGIPTHNPTDSFESTLYPAIPTHNPTVPQEIGGWNTQNSQVCTGNEGVPTNRQTIRQTVQQTDNLPEIPHLATTNSISLDSSTLPVVTNNFPKPIKQQIFEARAILDSLDNIKKEIRRKFKTVTRQEMLVFSTVYALEEQDPDADYKKIATKLGLSESSIRDYIQRIIKKGIPIEKEKLNNKKIILRISPELKNLASLDTIIKLRSL